MKIVDFSKYFLWMQKRSGKFKTFFSFHCIFMNYACYGTFYFPQKCRIRIQKVNIRQNCTFNLLNKIMLNFLIRIIIQKFRFQIYWIFKTKKTNAYLRQNGSLFFLQKNVLRNESVSLLNLKK